MSEPRDSEEQVQEENRNTAELDEMEDIAVADTQQNNKEPQGGDSDLENDVPTSGMGMHENTSQTDIPKEDEQNEESTQPTSNIANSTATVKIVLLPEAQVMTMAFAIGLSIHHLKHHFASELKVPPEVLQVSLNGSVVEEHKTLMELGVQPHGTAQLEMSSTDPGNHPLRPPTRPPQHCNTSDVITVRVDTGPEQGACQEVVVEIERPSQRKAFLGGYRHRLTGLEFHHASVQTLPKRRSPGAPVVSADTQTVTTKEQGQQCPTDVSTQMTTIGCYVSCAGDKLVAPGNYIPAHLYHSKRLAAVLTLQKYVRGWRAKRLTVELRGARDTRLAWLRMQETRRREEKEEQVRERRDRMTNPRSGRDLTLIYNALEKWRCEETERINATLRGAERRAALCALTDQVAEFIGYMARHRVVIEHDDYSRATRAFLDKCAAPRTWRASHGKVIEMDTPDILRARELRELYAAVCQSSFTRDERCAALLSLKHTVKDHDCQLTRDIVELIDRELALMPTMKKSKMEGLRQRISTLFLQYIKNPTFNPEAARFLKAPQNLRDTRMVMFCCNCQRPLKPADLSLAVKNPVKPRCQDCSKEGLVGPCKPYKTFLARLCADERKLSKESQIPYLLQEKDLLYLVEMVWGGHSALSSCSDVHDLALVRWDRLKDWSPWNCILLTKREAPTHLRLNTVHEVYEEGFISSVKYKHVLAKRYFSKIPGVAKYLHDVDSEPGTLSDQLVPKFVTSKASRCDGINVLSSGKKSLMSAS